jgi:hypothetical protein
MLPGSVTGAAPRCATATPAAAATETAMVKRRTKVDERIRRH